MFDLFICTDIQVGLQIYFLVKKKDKTHKKKQELGQNIAFEKDKYESKRKQY